MLGFTSVNLNRALLSTNINSLNWSAKKWSMLVRPLIGLFLAKIKQKRSVSSWIYHFYSYSWQINKKYALTGHTGELVFLYCVISPNGWSILEIKKPDYPAFIRWSGLANLFWWYIQDSNRTKTIKSSTGLFWNSRCDVSDSNQETDRKGHL